MFEPDAATDDRFLVLIILENHRGVLRAGILGGEHQQFGQIISSPAQKDLAAFLPRGLLRALKRGERLLQRAGTRVVAGWRYEIRLGAAQRWD